MNDCAPESLDGGSAGEERPEIQKAAEAVPAQSQLTSFWVASPHGRADSSFVLRATSLVMEIQVMPANFGGELTSIVVGEFTGGKPSL